MLSRGLLRMLGIHLQNIFRGVYYAVIGKIEYSRVPVGVNRYNGSCVFYAAGVLNRARDTESNIYLGANDAPRKSYLRLVRHFARVHSRT